MPELTINGVGTFDADEGERLVNAISQVGIDIGHRCGGQARCTTCRVTFEVGEPDVMTAAEHEKLSDMNSLGAFRLACQIVVDRLMVVEPLIRVSEKGWNDAGPEPAVEVEPKAEWFPRNQLDTALEDQKVDA